MEKIRKFCPSGIEIVTQGKYIAESLQTYLQRHPEMESRLTKGASCQYFTSESPERFSGNASLFLNEQIEVKKL
jgi:glutamate racemase